MKKRKGKRNSKNRSPRIVTKEFVLNDSFNINQKKEKIKKMTEAFGPEGEGWQVCVKGRSIGPMTDGTLVLTIGVEVFVKDPDPAWAMKFSGLGSSYIGKIEMSGMSNNTVEFSFNPESYENAYLSAVTDAISQIIL